MSSAESPPTDSSTIQILDPLEFRNWDSQLTRFPEATFFHTAAWARVLHGTYGYVPAYVAAVNGDRIESLLPVMEIDSWLTGRRGVSLPFTDSCEPLGIDARSIARLIAFAKGHAGKNAWRYLELRGGRTTLGDISSSGSYYGHHLVLQPDQALLFAQFDGSVRQAIRKAEQGNLTIEFSQSPAAIRTFYQLFCLTRQKHGIPPQPFAFFANIQRNVLAQNSGWVVLARQAGVPVAGAVFFHFGRSVIYKFGASDPTHQRLRANNLVMWAAIRRYAGDGFTSLDFGRTARNNEGLRRYKLGWGTQERPIDYFHYDIRQQKYVTVRTEPGGIIPRVGHLLPRFLSRLIGLILYKHIATIPFLFAGSRFGNTL